jgi:transposase
VADKGYGVNCLIDAALAGETKMVIPPKKSRKVQRDYDKELYKERYLVENVFRRLKQWRGIATRYAKRSDSFLAAFHLRCIFLFS